MTDPSATPQPKRRKTGRPSIYSDELAAELCARMASGRSLTKVCSDPDMPGLATVFRWLPEIPSFRERYDAAQEQRAQHLFDSLLEIADTPVEGEQVVEKGDGSIEVRKGDMLGHRRLQVDTRKWALAKMLPKLYGEKQTHEHTGKLSLENLVTAAIEAANPPKPNDGKA